MKSENWISGTGRSPCIAEPIAALIMTPSASGSGAHLARPKTLAAAWTLVVKREKAHLIPVLWIVSLSFKDPATITDATFWPKKWTLENYRGIFKTSELRLKLLSSLTTPCR